MTVSVTTSRVEYNTNGTTGPWTVPFYFIEDEHLGVIHTDSDGAETELALSTHYSVTGAGDEGGGSVTTVASYAAGGTITILRDVPVTQETDYTENDSFPAASHERALDKLTMIAQQITTELGTALRVPEEAASLPRFPAAASRANRLAAFDADGNPTVAVPDDQSAAALALILSSSSLTSEGAGAIGIDPSLSYPIGTLGYWVTQTDISVFRWIPQAQWAAILDGTSTYDASADITDAIDFCLARGGPARLLFPTGRYVCDSALGEFEGGDDLTIDFLGSVLDFADVSLVAAGPLLGFTGSYDATAALTANAAAMEATVSVNSSGFAAGDMVRVYSSSLWDSTRTSTRIGEISFIESIPGGASVTLVEGLQDSYATADTATLQKLTPIRRLRICNGTFLGPGGDDQLLGIRIILGMECAIEGMATRDIDLVHMRLENCVQSRITGCFIQESREDSQAYGISFRDACQDCQATNNFMRDVRHGFTTNNGVSSNYGIIRRALIAHNQIFNSVPDIGAGITGDALDTHAGSEDIHFHHNTVSGAFGSGINFEGRSGSIIGNAVHVTTGNGILYWNWTDRDGEIVINDNRVSRVGDDTATNDYGITVLAQAAAVLRAVVNGNTIQSKSVAIRIVGTATLAIGRLICNGNNAELRVSEALTSAGDVGVDLRYVSRGSVSGNVIYAKGYGFNILNSTHMTIVGNQVDVESDTVTRGVQANDCDRLTITANDFFVSVGSPTGTGVNFSGSTVTTNSAVRGNNFSGFSTNVNLNAGTGSVETDNL